jgi:hypothetical protein
MDNRLTPQQQDALIEEALRSQPLAPMPRDITTEVMAHIKQTPAPRPFSFTHNDLALGVVLASCIGAIWFALQNLPPLARAQMHMYRVLLYQDLLVNADWLIPALTFGAAAVLAALTIPYLVSSSRS